MYMSRKILGTRIFQLWIYTVVNTNLKVQIQFFFLLCVCVCVCMCVCAISHNTFLETENMCDIFITHTHIQLQEFVMTNYTHTHKQTQNNVKGTLNKNTKL